MTTTTNTSAILTTAAQRNTPKVVDRDKTGFAGMTADDFMKILIAQLQNQDPANPMDSDQLLNQVSEMRALQSNLELSNSIKSLTLSQQLSSASGFLGKQVDAIVGDKATPVSGIVSRVQVKDGEALLRVGSTDVKLSEVRSVTTAS